MKFCLVTSSVDNIISINRKIGHSSIREDLDVYGMVNGGFIIFHNCNHCMKEYIPFLSVCFCSLNFIHALKKKINPCPD